MKKTFLLLAVFSLFNIELSYGATGDKSPKNISNRNEKIYEVTSRELSSFLEIIPVGAEKQHGFDNREEFKRAVAGSIYTVVGIDADWNTFSTDIYNIPVIVDNQYKAVISVSYKDGVYNLETVGAAELASELEKTEPVMASDHDYIMLNVYSRASSFVAYPAINTSPETANFIPLASAKTGLNIASKEIQSTYALPQLINIFKAEKIIKAN
ncbi:MAG: hypothetical protein ABI315_10770 [Bacteroidia bacterium]